MRSDLFHSYSCSFKRDEKRFPNAKAELVGRSSKRGADEEFIVRRTNWHFRGGLLGICRAI